MLESLDLFGRRVEFKFNGKAKFKSLVGGIASGLLVIFITWATIYSGQDLILRDNPKTTVTEYFTENPQEVVIMPNTFNLGFGLKDITTSKHYIDESVYNIEVVHNKVQRDTNGSALVKLITTKLETERCTIDHFGVNGVKFTGLKLSELYCLKAKQPVLDQIRIQGSEESPIFEYLTVNLRQCSKESSDIACAQNERIVSLLERSQFAVYFPNTLMNLKDYDRPNTVYRDNYSTKIRKDFHKHILMQLRHIELESNIGWMLDQKDTKKYIDYYYSQEEIVLKDDDATNLLTFNVQVSQIKTLYERSYIKVQNILASVDGFATMGVLSIVIFLIPYSRIKFYEHLINELFEVKDLQTAVKNARRKKKKLSDKIKKSKFEDVSAEKPIGNQDPQGINSDSENISNSPPLQKAILRKRKSSFLKKDDFSSIIANQHIEPPGVLSIEYKK